MRADGVSYEIIEDKFVVLYVVTKRYFVDVDIMKSAFEELASRLNRHVRIDRFMGDISQHDETQELIAGFVGSLYALGVETTLYTRPLKNGLPVNFRTNRRLKDEPISLRE